MGYEIVTDESLLTIDKELQGKIKVIYENNPIEDISLLVIKFLNQGNEPIKSDDFEEPITMSFSPNVGILSVELKQADPPTINVKLTQEKDRIIIEPLLLNRGDSITIKVLLTGSNPDCDIPSHANLGAFGNAHPFKAKEDLMLHSRIIGVKVIKQITDYIYIELSENRIIKFDKHKIRDFLMGVFIGLVGLVLAIIYGIYSKNIH